MELGVNDKTMANNKSPLVTGLLATFLFFLGWLLLASPNAVMQVSLWLNLSFIEDLQPYLSYAFIVFGVAIFFIHMLRR